MAICRLNYHQDPVSIRQKVSIQILKRTRKIIGLKAETLKEVYGPEIKNFSAKGRYSDNRPGINKKLYKGLL